MAYNTKAIKTDVNGNPISQYYNPETDEYEPVEGASGGNKVIIYNEDGTPNNSLNFGEILDKLDQLTGTVIAEQTRQQNEAIRQQNEQDRIDLYNALKDLDVSQYELRLQKLEHDTSVEEFILEEAYGSVISLPSNVVNGQINEINIFGNTEAEEDNVKSTFGAIRLKSVNEDETKESILYILGRDEEGNILELRSLPNGVKDEVNIGERKVIIRTKEVVLNGGENWSIYKVHENTISFQLNIPDKVMAPDNHGYVIGFNYVYGGYDKDEEGYSFSGLTNRVYININKNKLMTNDINGFKEWLSENPVTLIYRLAEPIEMPVEVFGSLQSYENSTVYVDTIIPRIDFYDINGIAVDVPIGTIDTLYKVDKETGYLYSLDISQAEISQDRLSFIHPDLVEGDLVDWDYEPALESTSPGISMKLPTNLKASVNSLLDAENRNRKDIEWNKIKLGLHIEDKDNPHNITPDQIGAETPDGAQAKVDALAGEGNTKTVKQLDNELSALAQQLYDLLSGGEEYTATLQNGWSGNLTYRKNLLGQVVLSGQLTAGDTAPSTQICVLPAGFRPKHMLAIPVYNGTQGVVGTAFQLSTGGILYPRSGANINLNSGNTVYIHIIFSTI